ncbi:MAG: asparaginase [Pseudobacteriovorax sp.]|nr:asparaginase [Pseudobacteriovorax sp.]
MTITIADAPAVFALNRGGFTEQLHYGFYYIKLGDSVLTNWHQSSKLQLPTRSLLKPWQFQGAGPHIESPESLLGLSSHSAQPFHLETIDRWLSELPISENQLICPPSRPYDVASSHCLPHPENQEKKKRFHFCSGKHLYLLKCCERLGLPFEGYHLPDHPIQSQIRSFLEEKIGKESQWVTDSCGLPSLVASIETQANLWAEFGEDTSSASKKLRHYWGKYPQLTGGFDRLDTEIMLYSEGRLLAKEGADGLLAIQTNGNTEVKHATVLIKSNHGLRKENLGLILNLILTRYRDRLPQAFEGLHARIGSTVPQWIGAGHSIDYLQ